MSVDHSVDPALFVDGEIAPARAVRRLTKGQPLPLGDARSLWIGTAGTLNFVDSLGVEHADFPAQAGVNPIKVQALLAGGTADDVWALY